MRRRQKASQHKIRNAGRTKPGDLMATVNDAVVQGKFMFLSGEICLPGDRPFSSKALDDQALGLCRGPSAGGERIRWKPIELERATVPVIRQKSAEVIVVKRRS